MSVIEIKRDWSKINRPKINRFLARRFYGWWPAVTITLLLAIILTVGILGIQYFLPEKYYPQDWLAAFVLFYFMAIALSMLNGFWKKKLLRNMAAAPIRTKCESLFLSEYGVSDYGPPQKGNMSWDYVIDVVQHRDLVLLLLSPMEYIPFPISSLPDGLTSDALLKQIEDWRAATAA